MLYILIYYCVFTSIHFSFFRPLALHHQNFGQHGLAVETGWLYVCLLYQIFNMRKLCVTPHKFERGWLDERIKTTGQHELPITSLATARILP